MKLRTSPSLGSKLVRHSLAALIVLLLVVGAGGILPSFYVSQSLAGENLSPETTRLFEAIRAEDLAGVQGAIVDGADLNAVDKDNLKPADLAEELEFLIIAHFLRAFQVIEGGGSPPSQPMTLPVEDAVDQPSIEIPPTAIPEGQYAESAGAILQKLTQVDDDLEDAMEVPDASLMPREPSSLLEPLKLETTQPGDRPEEEEDFFAEMKVFGGEPEQEIADFQDEKPVDEPVLGISVLDDAPAGSEISRLGNTDLIASPASPLAQVIPEHERLRNAVLLKLRRESKDRLATLEDARDKMAEEVIEEERAVLQATGVENIQTELRAKKRTELSGSALPPGYVPPPDGGNSATRFMQRLGLFDNEENAELPLSETDILADQLRAALARGRSQMFVERGYNAPPAGQVLETSGDNAVAVIGQMTRLFSPVPGDGQLVDTLSSGGGGGSQSQTTSQLVVPPDMRALPQGINQGIVQAPGMVAPYSQPVIPPYPVTSTTPSTWDVKASMGGLSGSMQSTEPEIAGDDDSAESPVLDVLAEIFGPDARQQTAETPSSSSSSPSPLASGGSWDVIAVNAAPAAGQMMMGLPQGGQGGAQVARPSVTAATPLVMGRSGVLGKSSPAALNPNAIGKSCINKHQRSVTFCIEQIDWPEELRSVIWVDTVMYQGLNAIVRYDNGVATRYHALFPSESFRQIIEYYIATLGPPHTTWNRSITPLAAPQQANPSVSWKALNPYTQVVTILEIRQFDDTRGGFPDEKRGAIMLHNAQSGTIFPQVSAFELMRLRPL